jgi:excisionase family DNA binding protein
MPRIVLGAPSKRQDARYGRVACAGWNRDGARNRKLLLRQRPRQLMACWSTPDAEVVKLLGLITLDKYQVGAALFPCEVLAAHKTSSLTVYGFLLGGISRNTIYQLLRTGELASVVIGCRRFISRAAIDELIAKSTTTISPSRVSTRSRVTGQTALPLSVRLPLAEVGL